MTRIKIITILFFTIGLLLRLGMLSSPLTEDERKNIVVAQHISLSSGLQHLPMESKYVTHPLLNVYITKLGQALFGETDFGARVLHLVIGVLAMWMVFGLGRTWGELSGCVALALLALNPFHIHESIRAENSATLYTFAAGTLLFVWRYMNSQKTRHILLAGLFMGLAFLTKGDSILLAVAIVIYLAVQGKLWEWLGRKSVWAGILVFVLTISPWLIWTAQHGSSQLMYQPSMYALDHLRPNFTTLHLYLIRPMYALMHKDYRMYSSWEYGTMDGLTGILLLVGVGWAAWTLRSHLLHQLMLIVFLAPMMVLSFFTLPGLQRGEFWWAWLSLIPAVCLTGDGLAKMWVINKGSRLIVVLVGLFALGNAIYTVQTAQARLSYPPHHLAVFVDDDQITAKIYEDKKQYPRAIQEVKRLLSRAPNNIDNWNYLGWLYWSNGQFDESVDAWLKSKELFEEYAAPANKLDVFLDDQIYKYQQRLQVEPDDTQLHFFLGALLYHVGDGDNALDHLNQIRNGNALYDRAVFYKGLVHRKQKDIQGSQRHFKLLMTENSAYNNLAFRYYGINLVTLGNLEGARKAFESALAANPDDILSQYELSRLYERLGQMENSVKINKQMLEMIHSDIRIRIKSYLNGRYRDLLIMKQRANL